MMIQAVGIDVVEIDRIRRAMLRPGFLERVLTPRERATATTPARVAGRWAAKEAVAKCLAARARWHEVEISTDTHGAPQAVVAERLIPAGGRIHLSITHERGIAAAVAVLEVVA